MRRSSPRRSRRRRRSKARARSARRSPRPAARRAPPRGSSGATSSRRSSRASSGGEERRRDRARGRDARPLPTARSRPRTLETAGRLVAQAESLAPGALHVGDRARAARAVQGDARGNGLHRDERRRRARDLRPQGARDEPRAQGVDRLQPPGKRRPGPWLSGTYAPAEADSPVLQHEARRRDGVRAVAAASGCRRRASERTSRRPSAARRTRARRTRAASFPRIPDRERWRRERRRRRDSDEAPKESAPGVAAHKPPPARTSRLSARPRRPVPPALRALDLGRAVAPALQVPAPEEPAPGAGRRGRAREP